MPTVLVITNIPNPYRVPLFNTLAELLAQRGMRLHVGFGAAGNERRQFRLDMNECTFEFTVLKTKRVNYQDPEKTSFTYDGLFRLIEDVQPQVIVTNAFSVATLKLWLRSWFGGRPYIIWSGAIEHAACKVSWRRTLLRRLMVARAAGFVAYGGLAKQYLVSLGAPAGHVSVGINTVDTEFFARQTRALRASVQRPPGRRLVCVSYLEPRKKVEQLLYLARELLRHRDDFQLTVLGDGSELQRLRSLSQTLGVERVARFEGFVQKQDLPKCFAESDCLLFPTDFDVWGLVLVEAMAAGLPAFASINAGAVHDLIEDGVTGFGVDFADVSRVAERVAWLLDRPEEGRRIGERAAEFIAQRVNLRKSAEGFVEAIRNVTEGKA